MTPMDMALSFVISYVAGMIPTAWFENHKSIEEKLEVCFKRAVNNWTMDATTRDLIGKQMNKYLPYLKDFIAHKPVGRHPRENDLLRLWATEIFSDEKCSQFILEYEHQIMAIKLDDSFLTAQEILDEVKTLQKESEAINKQIDALANRGLIKCRTFWEQWSTGPNISLNVDIVLSGRTEARTTLLEKCQEPNCIYIEGISAKEAMAFAVATFISESEQLVSRTIVATDEGAYRDMVENCNNMIIITDITENAYYVARRGNTVIVCVCPSNNYNPNDTIKLPIIDKEGFIKSLSTSGIDEAQARMYAIDSVRDVNILRHILNFADRHPVWFNNENCRLLIPALLLGGWNEEWDCDKELVAKLARKEYADYISEMTPLLLVDETPLVRIGSIWRVKAPYDLMTKLLNYITQPHLDAFAEIIEWIMLDDDPDAKMKMETEEFCWWQNKQMFSGSIKRGVLQELTLLAIVQGRFGKRTDWVDSLIEKKLQEFTLERYLTQRHNLEFLAEASPKAFLNFIQKDIQTGSTLIEQLMKVKHKRYSLVGTEIYYTELLFVLEALSWDEQYLKDTTEILMELCTYPNDSNYSNRPINSLSQIYRFLLPQTYCSLDYRIEVLHSLVENHQKMVYQVCLAMLKGIENHSFIQTSHFKWRLRNKKHFPKYLNEIRTNDVVKVAQLMLDTSVFSSEEMWEILEVSSNRNMDCCRPILLDAINSKKEQLKGNDDFIEKLRKEINQHLRYKDVRWNLKEEELQPYRTLLEYIESDNILKRNVHFFAEHLINEPDLMDFDNDYPKKIEESKQIRTGIIKDIIDQKGIETVWEFEKMVTYKESVADAIFVLYEEQMCTSIYEMYCEGKLDETFVKHYFFTLYYQKGESSYIPLIEKLYPISKAHIAILLYAPSYQKALATIAATMPADIEKEYWQKVSIWSYDNVTFSSILDKLRFVERYADVLTFIANKNNPISVAEDKKIEILIEIHSKGRYDVLRKHIYQVGEILKVISLPVDEQQRIQILRIEFFLFDQLRHYMPLQNLHFMQVINQDPGLLMELVKLAYLPDEGFEDEILQEEKELRRTLASYAYNFFFHYHQLPCIDNEGNLDEKALMNYLDVLQELAVVNHRVHVMPLIIGRILGNFPETDKYPTDVMCQLVEQMNNDAVDSEISCVLSNRRGMTTRACNEGGIIERKHVETFKKYIARTRTRSPRLTRIFEQKVKEYEYMAEEEDNKAKLFDFGY